MLTVRRKWIYLLSVAFTLSTCIDPYNPKLSGYESLLVVDGLITDENTSYTVKLSKTLQEQEGTPEMISDASVSITDDKSETIYLRTAGSGIYKTDSTCFKGIVGRTYVLHIVTGDGNKYESEPCLMQSVPEIDSIYYTKEEELVNNGTEINAGIRIYLDSKEGVNNKYYRWEFEETWKFKLPTPEKFYYENEFSIVPLTKVNQYCWKNNKSSEILIHSVYNEDVSLIREEPIVFIVSDKSDRLMLQYSILIRQYSISKNEYNFWDNLKKVNESGGDIFASQPFPVVSNIRNINDPDGRVLGYFQVSAVKQKRKEIQFSDIVQLNLPFYQYPCIRIEDSPDILPWAVFNPPLTWDDIYYMYTTSGYSFVEPKYLQGTTTLDRLVFTTPECADCELTGTLTKPDFWTDLK
jgi:hypothetical protein